MYSSFKTSSILFEEIVPISKQLKNADNYWAHTPPFKDSREPEKLEEHIDLVNYYCKRLVEKHGLNPILDSLISDFIDKFSFAPSTGEYIKKLFIDTIVFHDYGKINENFQVKKMKNPFFKKNLDSPIDSRHSSLGAFIYLAKHFQEIQSKDFSKEEKAFLVPVAVILSYSIFKHHSFQLDDEYENTLLFTNDLDFSEIKRLRTFMKKYVEDYNLEVVPQLFQLIGSSQIFKNLGYSKFISSFPLYSLCRLNFSLLTASDYLATHHYMNNSEIDEFGILSKSKIEEIFLYVTQNEWLDKSKSEKNYNRQTYQKLNEGFSPEKPQNISGQNLNKLRQAMAFEVIQNIHGNLDENLFYIEAPTGGGKTNLSLLAVIEILKAFEGKINKVFYVFPFTTLITQTYKSIKQTFGLSDQDIVQLHSKAGFQKKNKEDDEYGSNKTNYVHYLFANFPFSLLTHVRFFEILKSSKKETNYLLHRLANSVVVIDELQSYPPKHWDKVIYFIKQYASSFNIKFIVMSATLPKIDKLQIGENLKQDFTYLLPNAKEDYFQNPNFCDRVSFNFDLFEKKGLELNELSERLFCASKNYAENDFGAVKPKGSVYTIIEFIFKKTASEFYQLSIQKGFFDEVFLLSGAILEPRRKYIINYLKNTKNRKKKVLLVTTQVVEAGVDIDMDIGFKDSSLIDSDEQLAGRINRNINKKDCTLWLFNYDKSGFVYGNDKRLEISRKFKPSKYQEILKNKKFDELYDPVIQYRNHQNKTQFLEKFNDYKNLIEQLKFKSVNDNFQLIEQENISCFIPLNISTVISKDLEEIEYTFNESEWEFLQKNSVYPNSENEISGEEIFDLYINLIEQKQDFIQKKTNQKILQGIMSNFIFSIFASPKTETQIVRFSDEEKSDYGYKYIERWSDFYDIDTGLRTADFESTETQFL